VGREADGNTYGQYSDVKFPFKFHSFSDRQLAANLDVHQIGLHFSKTALQIFCKALVGSETVQGRSWGSLREFCNRLF
jgi:hypothetical protein